MQIGPADTERQVAIIAEIGNNHEGDLAVARELVEAAAGAGAHAVKFQAIDPAELVHPDDTARLAQLERFRFTPEQFAELAALARSLGIGFVCSAFSLEVVDWLAPFTDVLKVASGDNDYVDLLEHMGATGKPVIVSSGMTDVAGLRRAEPAGGRGRCLGGRRAALCERLPDAARGRPPGHDPGAGRRA